MKLFLQLNVDDNGQSEEDSQDNQEEEDAEQNVTEEKPSLTGPAEINSSKKKKRKKKKKGKGDNENAKPRNVSTVVYGSISAVSHAGTFT